MAHPIDGIFHCMNRTVDHRLIPHNQLQMLRGKVEGNKETNNPPRYSVGRSLDGKYGRKVENLK